MGLDIYAGTFTRYYAQNWKTITQQWAEENGYAFTRIVANSDENDEEQLSPDEIQEDMENYRTQLITAITPEGQASYVPWVEDNHSPYYTDKPDWDAYGALLLYAAAEKLKEPLPTTVPKGFDFNEQPLIKKMQETEGKNWSLFSDATCWIPIEDPFYFQGPMPNGTEAVIGTVGGLKSELEAINSFRWEANEETILSWKKTEGYVADSTISEDGKITKTSEYEKHNTESLAKYAFAMFWEAVQFSLNHNVPIILDY